MRNLIFVMLVGTSAFAQQQRDVQMGPIWNQADANAKCPNACRPPERWNGQWRTTIPGRMSVCSCVVDPQPMEVHGRYEGSRGDSLILKRDGRYMRGSENGTFTFDGRTLTLRPDPSTLALQTDGSFADAQGSYRPVRREFANRTPPEMCGEYQGVHPQWRDVVILTADGRFRRGSGDSGSWWFDGSALHLKWDRWGEAVLALQPDGSFFDANQRFKMARAVVAQPPPPPPPPPPPRREFRSRYLHLDRGFYQPNETAVVYWENFPQANGAWVSVNPRGAGDGEWGDWTYLRGTASGSFSTKPLAAGDYEVRIYGGAMSPVVDRLPFSVGR